MDLQNITTVTKASVSRQNFDIRYSKNSDRFTVADKFFASKNLQNNGFKFHLAEEGATALISIHPHEDAVFFKGKETSDQKNPVFSYNILADTLMDMGLIGEDDLTALALTPVGELDGVTYYKVGSWEDSEETVATNDTEETAEVDNTADMTPSDMTLAEDESNDVEAEVETEAEVEEDPFA